MPGAAVGIAGVGVRSVGDSVGRRPAPPTLQPSHRRGTPHLVDRDGVLADAEADGDGSARPYRPFSSGHGGFGCRAEAGSGGSDQRPRRQVWERANETRKPLTVTSPMARCASWNASGIIVSAVIARIAPAATAVTAAITVGEKWLPAV